MTTDRRATPITITLEDREGVPHDYCIIPHDTTTASPILVELLGAFSPLMARVAAEANRGRGGDTDLKELLLRDPEVAEKMGEQFGAGVVKLSPAALKSLFMFTTRDGQPMKDRLQYDVAYAGNMLEWLQAAVAIVRANGFIPF